MLKGDNIMEDFSKTIFDELNRQKSFLEFVGEQKMLASKESEINRFESVLVYLIITGKLDVETAKKLGYNIEYLNNLLKRYHMDVSLQDPSIKTENSKIFLEFMFANKFQPEYYSNILELIQSVPNSLSQYLTNYKQFLLSEQVSYVDLENYKVFGARGYIDKNEGIVVPKSIEADAYFRKRQDKVPDKQVPRYIYPMVTDCDSIISYYDWTAITNGKLLGQVTSSMHFPVRNHYTGFILNKDDENLKEKVDIISNMLEGINKSSSQEHTLAHDTISSINKEFYLIKKR